MSPEKHDHEWLDVTQLEDVTDVYQCAVPGCRFTHEELRSAPVRADDLPCRCGSTKAAHRPVAEGGCTQCPCPGYTTTAREELDLYRSQRAAGAIPAPVEPFADWRQQTAALEDLEAATVRGWLRALGANR